MYDFGKPYRKIFLEQSKRDQLEEKQVYWLLLITSMYVIIHMGYYLYRTYIL